MPSNPYYQFTSGQPVATSRASSAAIRTEFGTIQAGFDVVNTAVSAKGAASGQTWTGTHNFPATTFGVTASPGATGSAFATLDFVNAVAYSAALPPGPASGVYDFVSTNGALGWTLRTTTFTDTTKLAQAHAVALSF
jgi:hypothetical protein